jgi:predicted component of type VI protein secretion system
MNFYYSLYYNASMLDHYQDRMQETKSVAERAFVRLQIHTYKKLLKKSGHPMKTNPVIKMKTLVS